MFPSPNPLFFSSHCVLISTIYSLISSYTRQAYSTCTSMPEHMEPIPKYVINIVLLYIKYVISEDANGEARDKKYIMFLEKAVNIFYISTYSLIKIEVQIAL